MSYYLLGERIQPCNAEDLHDGMDSKYVAVLTTPEWKEARDSFDMGIELEENENGFFSEENLRYIHLFMNLMARRHDSAVSLREHTMQVRDLYNSQLDVRQNRTMTLLTVITTIFMPLTLIAGWYGMNFVFMPELTWKWGYPVVIAVSVAIVIFCLILFRKKKWL